MRTPLLIVTFLLRCSASLRFVCPEICLCFIKSISCDRVTEAIAAKQNITYRRLVLNYVDLRSIPNLSFDGLRRVKRIEIAQSVTLETIERQAFNSLPNLSEISIQNTRRLVHIHKQAFNNLPKLRYLSISNTGIDEFPDLTSIFSLETSFILDVSSTALDTLPSHGLESVQKLVARSAFMLKSFPPLKSLRSLREAHLTYPSHCCALLIWDTHREASFSGQGHGFLNCAEQNPLAVLGPLSAQASFGNVDFEYPELDSCHTRPALQCSPEADAFNPCEDIVGFGFLRVAIWFINILAVAGNLTVLLVFFVSRCKLTVPRFLMCHLAFADFCIGVYLLMIASLDLRTCGHYSQHAIGWQTGVGCGVAGFLSVFGGELSVYTLSTITFERWHTITHSLRLECRLGLSQAAAIMAAGWMLCLAMALLPLVGISSYSKVSMCLPMDIETPLAQSYVILLLLFNVGAFLVICGCYIRIYAAVRHPEVPGRTADTKIAKRMAVLIFTDFLCMAPISFFAISAAFKAPLITVTNSKILLVLFFPINSCANPFLYAIFTKAFRKDACMMMSSMGCCKSKANMYRMKTYCSENAGKSKSRSGNKSPRAAMWLSSYPHQKSQLQIEGMQKDS